MHIVYTYLYLLFKAVIKVVTHNLWLYFNWQHYSSSERKNFSPKISSIYSCKSVCCFVFFLLYFSVRSSREQSIGVKNRKGWGTCYATGKKLRSQYVQRLERTCECRAALNRETDKGAGDSLTPQLPWRSSAKSLQSCPTLCDPMDHSLPDSSVHGIFPSKNPGVCYHFLLQGIFPNQESSPRFLCLLHCRWILYN